MVSKTQLIIRSARKYKNHKNKTFVLAGNPQKKGTCLKVFVTAPKKPNSATRKLVKVIFISSRTKTLAYIPGKGHNLQRYSTVLIRGGRVRDLPGVSYRVVRGKFDLKRVFDRVKARSKYGIKKRLV